MSDPVFDRAVSILKTVFKLAQSGDPRVKAIHKILNARDQVHERYQNVFSQENLPKLTDEEFREFLVYKNNQHWMALQRHGPDICKDMDRLREALSILLDENRPIGDRLSKLVPVSGSAYVPYLSKAILTPILMICHPDRYGVWNGMSENGMMKVDLWPELDSKRPFGERYEVVNEILLRTAEAVGVDLWALDALWWRIEHFAAGSESDDGELHVVEDDESAAALFGLEKHKSATSSRIWLGELHCASHQLVGGILC